MREKVRAAGRRFFHFTDSELQVIGNCLFKGIGEDPTKLFRELQREESIRKIHSQRDNEFSFREKVTWDETIG